jgi:hypothetical protein
MTKGIAPQKRIKSPHPNGDDPKETRDNTRGGQTNQYEPSKGKVHVVVD